LPIFSFFISKVEKLNFSSFFRSQSSNSFYTFSLKVFGLTNRIDITFRVPKGPFEKCLLLFGPLFGSVFPLLVKFYVRWEPVLGYIQMINTNSWLECRILLMIKKHVKRPESTQKCGQNSERGIPYTPG